jgi:DNA-binding NtrC family response regulator
VRHRGKGAPAPLLTDGAVRALCAYPWRGNVRELENIIEHLAVIAEPGASIGPEELNLTGEPAPVADASPASVTPVIEEAYHVARDRVIAQFERQYLTWLVNRAGGNMSHAARIAGADRTTLYRMMERHGLQRGPAAGWVVERPSGAAPEAEAGAAGRDRAPEAEDAVV